MAMRYAVLAMVPVTRFWRAVNLESNGVLLDWADALAGITRIRKMMAVNEVRNLGTPRPEGSARPK
jgi:hypothetical protein